MKKILIVDDSQGWVNHHRMIIKKLYPGDILIDTALSAMEANDKLLYNVESPYDIILTDMQMESDFLPLYAGEWFIEQIQKLPKYLNTRIIIISATPSIRIIAEKYNVDYIPKQACRDIESYKKVFFL